jgi:hypothetical protein
LTVLGFAAAIASAHAAPAPEPTPLDDTLWRSNDGCFIQVVLFGKGGRAEIGFDNGDRDTGTFRLKVKSLTIDFDNYSDTFLALYDGDDRLATAHNWISSSEDSVRKEECVFRKGEK